MPTMLKMPKMGKVVNITAQHDESLAVDENGCGVNILMKKLQSQLSPRFRICMTYFYIMYYIIQEPIINPTEGKSNILKCLERVFDNQSTSDFMIIVEKRPIYVYIFTKLF